MPDGLPEMEKRRRPPNEDLQGVLYRPLVPAFGVGVATGVCGAVYGRVAGTLIQTPNPWIYTTLSGTQWLCAGTTYFYCRSVLLAGPLSKEGSLHKVAATGIAGACSGAVAGTFLPRGSVIPGSIMFGVAAALGQTGLNTISNSASISQLPSRLKHGLASLVPMKSLTDEEYEGMLQEKLLKVEAEISLLDDQIADLQIAREQHVQAQRMLPKDKPS